MKVIKKIVSTPSEPLKELYTKPYKESFFDIFVDKYLSYFLFTFIISGMLILIVLIHKEHDPIEIRSTNIKTEEVSCIFKQENIEVFSFLTPDGQASKIEKSKILFDLKENEKPYVKIKSVSIDNGIRVSEEIRYEFHINNADIIK